MVKTKRTNYFSFFMGDVEENPLWGFTICFVVEYFGLIG